MKPIIKVEKFADEETTAARFEELAKNMIKIDTKQKATREMILSTDSAINALVNVFTRDTGLQIEINDEMNKRINVLYYLFGILLFLWLALVGFITYLVFL